MTDNRRALTRTTSSADAAAEGLLSGISAGVLMAVSLIGLGMVTGEAPASVLGRLDPAGKAAPLIGGFAHLAVSGVYGIGFGLVWNILHRRLTSLPSWAGGLAYGLALFGLATLVLLPATNSPLGEIPATQFALAHVLYGLSLGLLIVRHHSDRMTNDNTLQPGSKT